MRISKEELTKKIEEARHKLNSSIEKKEHYEEIYENSVKLDQLIEQYVVAGF